MERFKAAFAVLERHIESVYHIPVSVEDVPDPNTGDFDGATIKVDVANAPDIALFVLAHLFGHTVQWTTEDRLRDLGLRYARTAPPPDLVSAVRDYERDASRLALTLLHEAGIAGLDAWLSDMAEADWRYLEHFYRTGVRGDPRAFFGTGAPVLEPLPIPAFAPRRFEARSSF